MNLIFEKSVPGRALSILPPCDVPEVKPSPELERKSVLHLPELSENDISRHYTELAKCTHGVNDGFYPLGSCTMKYNPKINEYAASLKGFTNIHPLQPECTVQGALEVIYNTQSALSEITGMDGFTLMPAAGAHGEFTGLLLIKAYHASRNDTARTKIIVPDSAHGTNPASAAMAGYEVVSIPSGDDGCVDLDELEKALGPDTAGLMLTNPNTVGIFDKNILAITKAVHEAGGLTYYDGANLNAVMGVVRPGDMGFDVIHVNLHKTFSTPHGGGGPGSGPVGCKDFLKVFLPKHTVEKTDSGYAFTDAECSVGAVREFPGNFLVCVKAFTYILTLGAEGIKKSAESAVLNANYMKALLAPYYKMAYDGFCMHEFVMSLEELKHTSDVSALDIAKALLDKGIHPPTMYFPLIVHEALMAEPTETESKETLDNAVKAFIDVLNDAKAQPADMHSYPKTTPIGRPDEVTAARKPVLKYSFPDA